MSSPDSPVIGNGVSSSHAMLNVRFVLIDGPERTVRGPLRPGT